MAKTIIEDVVKQDPDGKVGVLFVLPWVKNANAESIKEVPGFEQAFKLIGKGVPGYAVMTMKRTPGIWPDNDVEEKIAGSRSGLDNAIARYRPGLVVFMGMNLSRMCVHEFKQSTYAVTGTFAEYTTASGSKHQALSWLAPDKLLDDPYEFVRMPEVLSQIWAVSKKKYHKKPKQIINLKTYKSASEYIDFLANDFKGVVGFDTETHSLNRVHNQRLGSMQFCTDAWNAYVLLWDSKHQSMSARDLERLHPKLVNLFGSKDTSFDAWTMHHGGFDVAQIRGAFGVRTAKDVLDTMLLAHLMDENRKKMTHRLHLGPKDGPYTLKVLIREFFNYIWYSGEAMAARSNGSLMELPLPAFLDYAGYDPIVTWRLLDTFRHWAKLEKYEDKVMNLLRNLHSPALKMHVDMSRNGIRVDKKKMRELLAKDSIINARLAEIKQQYTTFPEVVKVNEELYRQESGTSTWFKIPFIFDMNKEKHRKHLFFHSSSGFKYPANEEGKYSTGKAFQKQNKDNKLVELFAEAQGLSKLRNAYVKPIFESVFGKNVRDDSDVVDGRVHPQSHMHRTVTGRTAQSDPNCIAEGTPIKVPCNQRLNPESTVPIEKLNVGDYVYCLDKEMKVHVKKVLNKWYKGKQHCLRIYWKSGNGRRKGHIDVTGDHKIKRISGKYALAQKLKVGDRLAAMSITHSGMITVSNQHGTIPSHSRIASSIYGPLRPGFDVHHRDGDHANNYPTNLKVLSRAKHAAAHRKLKTAKSRNAVYGSRFGLIRKLFEFGGRPAICRLHGMDFISFRNALSRNGVDVKAAAQRFGKDGKYISYARIVRANGPTEEMAAKLKIGTRKLKELCAFYGISYGERSKKTTSALNNDICHIRNWTRKERTKYAKNNAFGTNNHVITAIKALSKKRRVWDIEVEAYHNFFATDINVSNCQQVPRSDSPAKKEIKSLYTAAPGKILLQADLSAAEVRVWGNLSGDEVICRLSQEAFTMLGKARANPDDKRLRADAELKADFHKQTYGLCYRIDPKDVAKDQRQSAKKITFGVCYGMSTAGLAKELGIEVDAAEEIKKLYFGVYKGGEKWLLDTQTFALENGYVETPLGRRRRMPQVFTGDKKFISEAKRFAVNAPIQATASDYAMLATVILNEEIIRAGVEEDIKLINAVHDSVVLEVTATLEWIEYASALTRRVFTKDVTKRLHKKFGFDLKAPIDIDMEISQHYMHKCKSCGGKQYPGAGRTCTNKLKTGNKLKDGSDETKICGHDKYEVLELNGGWGWLASLEENRRGIANAMKGIKMYTGKPNPVPTLTH